MTSRAKFSLLSLTAVVVIGIFLWMRSLASWRPTKIGQVRTSDSLIFLSADERTCLVRHRDKIGSHTRIYSVDIATGKRTPWSVGDWYYFTFSQSVPELAVFTDRRPTSGQWQIREVRSGHLKRASRWIYGGKYRESIMLSPDGKTVTTVPGFSFTRRDVETGQLIRYVKLDDASISSDVSFVYATSPDETQIIGCGDGQGRVWDIQTGNIIRSWKTIASSYPFVFSSDARVVVYESGTSSRLNERGFTAPRPPYVFVDTATGKVLWDTGKETVALSRESFYGNEVFTWRKTGYEVLDIFTGHLKRRLSIPPDGGEILRITHDYIYTQNAKGEIFRWRAR